MKISAILEEKKLKLTSARKDLLEILQKEGRPVCFEDIKDQIEMNKATFYRNISTFENKAIVNSFEVNDKKRYYEIQKTPHMHFVCNSCNQIECLRGIEPVKVEGYIISDIILKGICKECV
jgi:Fur family transcriptional regulator, ferric uptake regulator